MQKILKAKPGDAQLLVQVKQSLPMPRLSDSTQQGGFLLGTSEAQYQFFIEHASCWLSMNGQHLNGFGIVLPDELLRSSEIWEKRHLAQWQIDYTELENKRLAYFEQLAFLPGNRKSLLSLSYSMAFEAFASGAETIIATTVAQPVFNAAALPLIERAGGQKIGSIEEYYPEFGHILSHLHKIERQDFIQCFKNQELVRYLSLPDPCLLLESRRDKPPV